MIISHSKKFICLNPPKTGSGYRELLFDNYADISIRLEKRNLCEKVNRHALLNEAILLFEEKGWNINEYYKFCFVRNPWERFMSYFNMTVQHFSNLQLSKKDFEDFIKIITSPDPNIIKRGYFLKAKQDEFFLKEDEMFLNYVGSIENHKDDIKKISEEIGLELPNIDRIEEKTKKYQDKISKFWTEETVEIVKNFDIKTIELKNYEFKFF